jgi:probable rRNA maturation factor
VNIYISNRQNTFKISNPKIKKIISKVIASENQRCDEVSISFVSLQEICQLHEQFFNDPSPTDCISLPMDDEEEQEYRVLGEVFVCPEIAIKYCLRKNTDPFLEIILYVVHGLLHLMGYDDITQNDRRKMRKAEKKHMDNLQAAGLLLNKKMGKIS